MSHEKAWMHFNPSVSSFGYDATDEMRANACLIATTPDLLSALVDLERSATLVARYGAQTGTQWSKLSSSLILTRAAMPRRSASDPHNRNRPRWPHP
jgi:hypothetical protein